MSDNEFLLALKNELQPMKDDIQNIKLKIENVIEPNIQLLAENYVPAAKKYEKETEKIAALQVDVELLKKVVEEHSVKLQKIS